MQWDDMQAYLPSTGNDDEEESSDQTEKETQGNHVLSYIGSQSTMSLEYPSKSPMDEREETTGFQPPSSISSLSLSSSFILYLDKKK